MKQITLLYLFAIVLTRALVKTDTFPDDFIFGVSTAAYQIEGAWNESGRGESMWDWFTHRFPHKIEDGSNGDIACDSYNRYEEDIELMKDLGVQFYRMSISWTRILPTGHINKINWEGVNYYLKVLKKLNESGIEPVVTLYHWDLPQNFNEMGGWTNTLLVDYFGEYARLCYKLFGDYIKYWITLNEPQTTCVNGYSSGTHAPGLSLTGIANYLCAYVHLKAHAEAYHIYHNEFYEKQKGKVSIVLVSYWTEPNNSSVESDMVQAEKVQQFAMGLFAHPIFKGNWPQIVIDVVDTRSELAGYMRSRLPKFTQKEIEYINGTADFFGLNYYSTYKFYQLYNVTDVINKTSFATDIGFGQTVDPTWPKAVSSWLYDVPQGLRKLINWVADQYGDPEIFITENGFSDNGSTLNDAERIHYLNGHMCETLRAITEDNRKVFGYTEWSLMDNFEWSAGYTERFGIVHVDFKSLNLTRTPKASYSWYKDVIQTKSINCADF